MNTVMPNVASDLSGLFRKELRLLLEYLAGISTPVPVDAVDQSLVQALDEYLGTEQLLKERVLQELGRQGVRPEMPSYPMTASTYNFLRPRALADVFLRTAKKDKADLEELRARYEDAETPEARNFALLLDDFRAARASVIGKMESILGTAKPAGPVAASAPKAETAAVTATAATAPAGPAWHDESLAIDDRMILVKGMGVFEQLFAAMAQTDCTACGYDCEGYARAIADGDDKDLTKCAPGELETQHMLEKIMGKR